MAVRKFLFMDATEGFSEEQAVTDELLLGKLTLSGISGVSIAAGSAKITGVSAPSAGTDAANKDYVDSVASGLDIKDSVRLATVVALPAYTPTGSGVGKILTASAVGILSVDGVASVLGDRILVKDEGSGTSVDNGLYEVTTEGTAGVPFVLTRVTDADQDAEVTAGMFAFVEEGTLAETGWVLSTDDPITVDTTALTFTQFTGAGQITAGAGLLKTGNTIDVRAGDGIEIVSDFVSVDLGTNPGLEFIGAAPNGELAWKPDTSRGLAKDGSGAYVDLAGTPGLEFASGDLQAKVDANGGIERVAAGLGVKLNGTTLQKAAAGLSVKGLPLNFEVNTVATTGGTVTASALDNLTDGTNADSLHAHSGTDESQRLEEDIKTSEALSKGDPVAWSGTANELAKGDAANNPDSRIMGISRTALGAAATGPIVRRGTAAGVLTAATPGQKFFLASGGGLTTTRPVSGARVIQVGFARSPTDLEVIISDLGRAA